MAKHPHSKLLRVNRLGICFTIVFKILDVNFLLQSKFKSLNLPHNSYLVIQYSSLNKYYLSTLSVRKIDLKRNTKSLNFTL